MFCHITSTLVQYKSHAKLLIQPKKAVQLLVSVTRPRHPMGINPPNQRGNILNTLLVFQGFISLLNQFVKGVDIGPGRGFDDIVVGAHPLNRYPSFH